MEQLVQCPVCTLYLHNGMSLESHLDTHPKDQVIKALCSMSSSKSNFGSRASTPMHSERSYRSRSRTPATDDVMRWNNHNDYDRYWRKTPSRTPKTATITRSETPEARSDLEVSRTLVNADVNSISSYCSNTYPNKIDRTESGPMLSLSTHSQKTASDYDTPYHYFQEKEEKEIKFSRSAEYTSMNSVNSYNLPLGTSCMKTQPTMLAPAPAPKRSNEVVNLLTANKKTNDYIKVLPNTNNIALVKANMGSLQYIAPGVMMSTPTFVQKNPQSNLLVTNVQNSSPIVQSKLTNQLNSNQYTQVTPSLMTPNTTVVTQNSQIIYSEIHNIDGKRYLPSVVGQENVTNVAQTNSLYQNVMVVDQFGNTSCVYTTPQQLLPKQNTNIYHQSTSAAIDKNSTDPNKTLVIEVGPIIPPPADVCDATASKVITRPETLSVPQTRPEKVDPQNETSGVNRGLKILSNVKVEVPVQHHKNLLNTVVDLTLPNESEYSNRCRTPERILPDIECSSKVYDINESSMPSASSADVNMSNTFSVIKNVGNPPSYKETKQVENKIPENESSDSCPVPDLICNEKPSISPCSELSDNGDNATTHHHMINTESCSQVPEECSKEIKKEPSIQMPIRTYKSNPLRLNNIFVKKHKKVLHIKNARAFPVASTSSCTEDIKSEEFKTIPKLPEDFTVTKIHTERSDTLQRSGKLETVSINTMKNGDDFDADTEEQSMDMELEPVTETNLHQSNQAPNTIDLTQVKDEVNSSHEFSNHTNLSEREFTELESIRPINVVQYNNLVDDFDDDSHDRELLDLEAASKNKHFVSMMNDNYFGDNIYADYFTPDRVESFDAVRESTAFGKEPQKDGSYLWGESSQKVGEFVLPNFIHESYKIAESHGTYALGSNVLDVVRNEDVSDSKADVLSQDRTEDRPLNICADERMPPRGELSGQESNGDMEASWSGMYPEAAPEPYDLIARESWISDASDMDSNDKRDNLEDLTKPQLYPCMSCGAQFPQMKELRVHRAECLPPPSGSSDNKNYRITARTIKKEEKTDENILAGMLQDSKAGITQTVIEVFDPLNPLVDSKPTLSIVKQETKRRRRDYVCPTCKEDQLTDVAFHEHLKIHPLECLTCGKCFFRRANLALHIKTHLGIKNFKCDICEKGFITRQKLLEHHNVHTGRTPVKCTLCDQSFRRYSNMVQHRDRHHFNKKPKIRDYVCPCGEVFHSRAKLRWHKETHDGKPKACQYCSDKFVHMSSLTRHVRRTHNVYYVRSDLSRKNENVTCPICKQVYLRANLKTHMRTHSGKRPYLCVICNKAFTTPWNLKLHRWTHMSRSAKPYKCGLCKGAFIRQSDYISHMNAHKSVRPYTCNYCGCQFVRKYNCQRHVREHEMVKKYICKVPDCGKSFHRTYYLSEHMKVHSGARPFSCNICGKTSSNKSNHNKHIKIHHAREPVATEA